MADFLIIVSPVDQKTQKWFHKDFNQRTVW